VLDKFGQEIKRGDYVFSAANQRVFVVLHASHPFSVSGCSLDDHLDNKILNGPCDNVKILDRSLFSPLAKRFMTNEELSARTAAFNLPDLDDDPIARDGRVKAYEPIVYDDGDGHEIWD
jgi:hypothetical protein